MELINNPNKTLQGKVELSELKKLIKRGIRRDTRDFEEESANSILEESCSTKKIRKALSTDTSISNPSVKNN